MRSTMVRCALVAMLVAVAWADHHMDHTHHHESSFACHVLSAPNADFGFSLYKSLNAKAAAGKNIFFSPLGISAALSMLSEGASGNTHSQLFSSLGFDSLNQSQVNEAFGHLFHMLEHNQENQQMKIGSAVAVRNDFSPVQHFLDDITQFYSGEVFKVDFSNSEEAAKEINSKIALKTNDMIKDMVKDLDPSLVMMLINYVYFRGQWENPFDATVTQKDEFHVDENTIVQVDMMKRTGRYDFYEDQDNHTSVVRLPYKGDASMLIVLPDNGKMKEVEGSISKEHIKHWVDSLSKKNVNILMPKYSISADASLDDTLKEMGITDAFGDNADFTLMSQGTKVKVSKVSHQAVLSVDETGTEAAAATTIEIMPMSMPEIFKIDRPFMVFIMEHSTRSILFMGKINNPTAK